MRQETFDSILFDMDGTLWDAVDSYCKIWNKTFIQCGINHKPVIRDELIGFMGTTLDRIVDMIAPEIADNRHFFEALCLNEQTMMPCLGGILYDGVKETIPLLSKHHKLFMVSNCSSHGLTTFLQYTGFTPYFTATLSHGETGLSKTENIRLIIDRYKLRTPLYIGDTQGDALASRQAGIAFVWAAYGFGHVDNPDYTIHHFKDIKDIIVSHTS